MTAPKDIETAIWEYQDETGAAWDKYGNDDLDAYGEAYNTATDKLTAALQTLLEEAERKGRINELRKFPHPSEYVNDRIQLLEAGGEEL